MTASYDSMDWSIYGMEVLQICAQTLFSKQYHESKFPHITKVT